MRFTHYPTLLIVTVLTLAATGCGKREPGGEGRSKAEQQVQSKSGMSAALLELKNDVQKQPRSGAARLALGTRLLGEGDAPSAVIELKHALELKHPEAAVLPLLAEAMTRSGQYKALVDDYAGAKLHDPAAQANFLAYLAQSMAAQGDLVSANHTIDQALAASAKSVPALLMKARLARARNETDAAIATLEGLLVIDPSSDAAWVLKAEILQRRPDGLVPAMQAYEQALKIQPKNTSALAAVVALQISQGNLEGARSRLAELIKVDPNSPHTTYIKGHVAYAAGEHNKARDIFQSILKILPEDVNILLSTGENELRLNATLQAESLFAKALALAPSNPIARRLLAQAQIDLGKAPQALLTLGPLVEATDAPADALFLAANARLMNGEAKAAEALYGRLAKLKPADPKLRTAVAAAGFGKQNDESVLKELRLISNEDRGVSADLAIISAYQRKQQYGEALEAAAALAHKRPKDPMVPYIHGRIYLLKKDEAAARKSFEQSLQISPTYFPAVAALSALDMQGNQAASARKRLEALLKLQPTNSMALLGLAEISAKQGASRAKVLKELTAAIKAAPSDATVRMALIRHHLQGGETDLALAASQSAVAAMPESAELLDLLARSQIIAKQTQQAISSFSKIAILNPKSPHASLGMIDAHLANNDFDAAQRIVEKLLDTFPDLPAALAQAAVIAVRKNQPSVALEIARRLQTRPDSAHEGLMLEGQIEISRGKWEAALPPLQKAIDQYKSSAGALLLHTALTRSGKTSAANALADRWLGAHPRDAAFIFHLGTLAESAGDSARAEVRYREAVAIDPSHAPALNNLAMQMLQRKEAGAVALAERAVESAQDKGIFLDTLAQAYAAAKQPDKAVEAQARAVALAPQEHYWRLGLAKMHLQAGNKAAAKAELDRLAALGKAFSQQDEVARLRSTLTSLASNR